MSVRAEILAANRRYAEGFGKGDLPMPPARRFAVITCMDARIDPAKALGLSEGDAHVIRNAGGLVTDDALRSLVISSALLGTEELFVIGHTGCGMLTFTNEEVHARLEAECGVDTRDIDFLPFADVEESVRGSVGRVRDAGLLPEVSVSGWVYDVGSGSLAEVALDG